MQTALGFETDSPHPFPTTIIITLTVPPYQLTV